MNAGAVMPPSPVQFSSLCAVLEVIRQQPPLMVGSKSTRPSPAALVADWMLNLRQQHNLAGLPQDTSLHIFRLLFPGEGVRRRYGLQEAALSPFLLQLFPRLHRGRLASWADPKLGSGCLGATLAYELRGMQRAEGSSLLSLAQ